MITKLKNCDGCQTDKPIWKNHEGNKYCKYCWTKIKKPKPIKKMSEKRKIDWELYGAAKTKHFKDFPICQYNGCFERHVEIHHKHSRHGELLYNQKYFMSVCRKHHNYIHENISLSIEQGYIIPRNDVIIDLENY